MHGRPLVQDLAFVRALDPRITAARTQLNTHLGAALEAALTTKAHSAALHCLHAYAELGETGTAEVGQASGEDHKFEWLYVVLSHKQLGMPAR
jgi:hypothetical protein